MRFISLCFWLILELVLLPIRLLAALVGGVLVAGGVLGTPAWLIQTGIGNEGSGPAPAWTMCLLSLAAIPAGLTLLSAATISKRLQPAAVDDTPAAHAAPDLQPRQAHGSQALTQRARHTDGIRLAYASLVAHQRRSRRATSALISGARIGRHRGAH
jgi:hypothetical protein